MVASTDIKFYVHTNNNAPQLTNNFGCMLSVLDAALINGIQIGTVSSLTASGKIVTAVFGTAHNLMQYQVIKIAGANQAEYNVEARILTVPNATTITLELATIPSVATATGVISCSLPPLGWEKPFGSVNGAGGGKGAYRSKNLMLPSRPFLRVVDERDPAYTATYAKYAKVGIVEDMTDIDTMLGVQAPFDPAKPNKNWVGTGSEGFVINGWAKWYYARSSGFNSSENDTNTPSSGSRSYIVIGNGDYFYILPSAIPNNATHISYGFGSFDTLSTIDSSNIFLSSTLSAEVAITGDQKAVYTGLCGSIPTQKIVLQRGYQQNQVSVDAKNISLGFALEISSGAANYIGDSSLNGIAPFAPVFISETVLRGVVPGIFWVFQTRPYQHLAVIEENNQLFMAINCATSAGVNIGQLIFRIGGL